MQKLYIRSLRKRGQYGIGAPTRKQVKRLFWEKLVHDTTPFRAGKPNHSDLAVRLLNGSTIHLEGMEEPARVDGSPWDGWLLSECRKMRKLHTIFGEHIRPALADRGGWLMLDSVPAGFGEYHDFALRACDGLIPSTIAFDGAYHESVESPGWAYFSWFSADVLTASEIEAAKRELDERTFRQEFEGSFESYEGQLYYTFNKTEHARTRLQLDQLRPVILVCDFNFGQNSPMVWEVAQQDGEYLNYCREVSTPSQGRTPAQVQKLLKVLEGHECRELYLTGDASGSWEGSKDHSTDYKIITDVLTGAGWTVYDRVPKANPGVSNRVGIGCSLLAKGLLRIDPSCTYLTDDLERDETDGRGGKDKTDKQRTHGSDCFDQGNIFVYGDDYTDRIVGKVDRWRQEQRVGVASRSIFATRAISG